MLPYTVLHTVLHYTVYYTLVLLHRTTQSYYYTVLCSKDLAGQLVWALDHYSDGETLNITGAEVSVRKVATAIAAAVGFEGEIVFNANQPDGPMRVALSDAKFRGLNPDYVATPFERAVRESVEGSLMGSFGGNGAFGGQGGKKGQDEKEGSAAGEGESNSTGDSNASKRRKMD